MDVVRRTRRKRTLDLALHRGDGSRSAVELKSGEQLPAATAREWPRERGREDEVASVFAIGVDVVLHHVVVELHDADHRHVEAARGLDCRGAESLRLPLIVREHADPKGVTCLHPEGARGADRYDDLVGARRIRQATLDCSETVLVEAEAIDAPERDLAERGRRRHAVRCNRSGDRHRVALDVAHAGQVRDGARQPPVLVRREAEDAEIGRVGVPQEGGIRRLRAPRAGEDTERQASDQADEDDEREVAAPAPRVGGPKAEPRDSNHASPSGRPAYP